MFLFEPFLCFHYFHASSVYIICLDYLIERNYNQITMETSIKFNIKKTVQYWLDGAEYDLSTAIAMFEKEKYPYALFMGHLALEKLLKALVVRTSGSHAPYTHSLPLLAEKTQLNIPKRMMKALARFMEFHFEARYPDDQNKFYKKCTKAFTNRNLNKMNEVYLWLKNQLSKQ